MALTDAIYYLSDEPDPALALPGILKHQEALGAFRHDWTLPVTGEVLEILESRKGVATKLGVLNRLVDAQEV